MTMRTPVVAGNWKMNTQRADAIALAKDIRARSDSVKGVERIVCPPAIFLHDVKQALDGSSIAIGAQDVFWEEKGAYTGEISVTQVAEAASHVIIGHSERRQFFGETDESVNKRLQSALAHGLTPIMCVGELLEQRQSGGTGAVLVRQVRGGLDGVNVGPDFIVAYEPVWAIGTGLAADGATAQKAIALIRTTLREVAGGVADSVRILYGGSVTADNMAEFIGQPDIDGGLVGGASLKADSFAGIIDACVPAA
jgi:triosephosphate isomerase